MIDAAEVQTWARRFGVSEGQIRRDHFISHVLRALAAIHTTARFFGGTALCRTYLDATRLSEDIDLLHPDPGRFLDMLQAEMPAALRREFPDTTWEPRADEGDGITTYLVSPGITAIKVYVGRDGSNTRAWEFEKTEVRLRYRDLPNVQELQCPTLASFAAMKLAAWFDRQAPRDLFDLAGLAGLGVLVDPNVDRLLRAKTGGGIIRAEFARVPRRTAEAWETELRAQVGTLPSADDCLNKVRAALPEISETEG